MNVALQERNVYEDFDLEKDVLFFKIGTHGLVSFHGRNYNRKKRLSAQEIQELTGRKGYFQISSSCYINIGKIKSIASGTIYFGSASSEGKQLTVNKRQQVVIEQLVTHKA